MFSNLKLRNRMLLGYTVPITLFIGLVVPVFSSATKVAESYRQTKISMTAIEETNDMGFQLAKMVAETRAYILLKDEYFLNIYQQSLQEFQKKADSVSQVVEIPIQKERLQKLIRLQQQYNDFSNTMINLVKQGKQKEATELLATKKGLLIINDFEMLNLQFNQEENQILDQAATNAEKNINFLVTFVVVSVILGITIALLAAFFISSGIAKAISDAVNIIASSARQIVAAVEEQERTTIQQVSAVNQTTTTMDQLGASSQQSASQAQEATESAQQALAITKSGGLAVQETLTSMVILKQRVDAIAKQIQSLNEQTNEISNISSVVTDLANQTNILALNATIEAVRAGENGKGFAVIATEIRKLSDESKKSAENINHLVIAIKNALDATVAVTTEGTKTTESGTKITRQMADAFAGVTETVNRVLLKNQEISQNSQQQAIAIQQVVNAMNDINQSTREASIGITQTKVGTKQLEKVAQNLNAIV